MRYPDIQWHALVVVDSHLEFEFENAALVESLIYITKIEGLASHLGNIVKAD
jgi:hypothetical protein